MELFHFGETIFQKRTSFDRIAFRLKFLHYSLWRKSLLLTVEEFFFEIRNYAMECRHQ